MKVTFKGVVLVVCKDGQVAVMYMVTVHLINVRLQELHPKCNSYSITKAQDTRSINICQIFFSRFNDLFKTRPSAIGQKYNICISLHVIYLNFSYNINFNI